MSLNLKKQDLSLQLPTLRTDPSPKYLLNNNSLKSLPKVEPREGLTSECKRMYKSKCRQKYELKLSLQIRPNSMTEAIQHHFLRT